MDILEKYIIPENCLDEVLNEHSVKPDYKKIYEFMSSFTAEQFKEFSDIVKLSFLNQGITYQVYNKDEANEHIFPFDLFPRIINHKEWDKLEKGVLQRNRAMNLFLQDVYNEKNVFKDKIVPEDMIYSSPHYCKEMENFVPPGGIYCHISGTDIIKNNDGKYYVLEDNLRSPSGVSYVLKNREALINTVRAAFKTANVDAVRHYPMELLSVLQSVSNESKQEPVIVVLTPGMYNSAYFEHAFLAQQMGVELVEGRDLYTEKNRVYLKTTDGPIQVDVVYRRIDDEYLDPEVFKEDSLLGVSGIIEAYKAGNVTIVNAPGTGIADDKAIYDYVPKLIKYYLDEEPILSNVQTYICADPSDLDYVLDNIATLVIKPVDESGGYGIKIGSNLSKAEIEATKKEIKKNPRKYVAQPILSLSTHSTFIEETDQFEPRHIDLRVYCLLGKEKSHVLKGGLTRVALKRGSLIVNSSQGGGSKDTWVLKK